MFTLKRKQGPTCYNITDSISSKMSLIIQAEYETVNDFKWVIKHWQEQKELKTKKDPKVEISSSKINIYFKCFYGGGSDKSCIYAFKKGCLICFYKMW